MAAAKKPQKTTVSSAKAKRGRPVGTTKAAKHADTPVRSAFGPSKSLAIVHKTAIKHPICPDVYEAFCFLPHKKQDELLKQYAGYVLHATSNTFHRAFNHASDGRKLEQMDETAIYNMLDAIFDATKYDMTDWALEPYVRQTASALMGVVHKQVPTLDRAEFYAIVLSMASNLFAKYLTVLKREGVLQNGLNSASLDAIAAATTAVDSMIKDGIFHRIAVAQKAALGGGLEVFENSTRAKVNAIKVSENMSAIDDTIEFFAKRLKEMIDKPTEKAHEATRVKSTRGRKPKARA